MKILITGGAGYIGSKLVSHLFNKPKFWDPLEITVYDNLMYNQLSVLPHIGNPNFRFVRGDVRDSKKLLKEVEKADKVIHLAAWVGAPMCEEDPRGALEVNQYSTADIAHHLSPNQEIIYPMSNSGYGVGGEDFCTEESPLNPISVYGTTKAESEKYVLEHPKSTVLRLATVFGPSPRPRIDLLVNDFTWRAWKEKCLVLFESHFRRNYIHVSDVCRAMEHFLNEGGTQNIYNVGLSDANLTKKELALAIQKVLPDTAIIESEIGSDPDKRDYIVSNDKIEALGWKPKYSIEDGVKQLLEMFPIIDNVNYELRNS